MIQNVVFSPPAPFYHNDLANTKYFKLNKEDLLSMLFYKYYLLNKIGKKWMCF